MIYIYRHTNNIYIYIYIYIYISIYLSVCLSIYLAIYLSTYLPTYLYTYIERLYRYRIPEKKQDLVSDFSHLNFKFLSFPKSHHKPCPRCQPPAGQRGWPTGTFGKAVRLPLYQLSGCCDAPWLRTSGWDSPKILGTHKIQLMISH